ncbi:aromatic ring-hydroxylating oxygenase subunit alpha [Halioxenophilus sp. WMMB6]|uniref:aromatic ring-hydroxylating oxygenase subunit alpha n=1 Tax=Halioxenophilus sp. WMMB6 TaxID=3073815 RepID=UPI00295E84C8|nr:SRPBCC family protein [Halioxenophilus sp. WMMB6]
MHDEPIVQKPASGFWTDAYPDLGRGPISLEDSVSPEFYQKEKEHVFKKSWLYIGRVEQLPQKGSHFTRELAILDTSILVVRGKDDQIRAFHNICPHRGNKLVWRDDPFQEVEGGSSFLYCRFHGWRFDLDGSLIKPSRADLLLDFDGSKCSVPQIQCEVWQGFIFINMNPDNTETVRDFLGEFAEGIEGYPFAGPHQVYKFKAELQCNWKIFMDGFAESYHGPYLHAGSFGALTEVAKMDAPNPYTDALAFDLKGPHRMFSFYGEPSQKTPFSRPIECLTESSPAGPWNKSAKRGPLPKGLNPTRSDKYGFDSFQFFPNFVLIFSSSGFTTHAHWPTGPHSHIVEVDMYFKPPTSHRERISQELTVSFLNDIVLEDASPLEGMQAMLNSGAIKEFYANDEEILVRHLHKVIQDKVTEGEKSKAEQGA